MTRKLETTFLEILRIEEQDDIDEINFIGSEEIINILDQHEGNVAMIQKALRELSVPLYLSLGTLGKLKRFADSQDVIRAVEIDELVREIRKKLDV